MKQGLALVVLVATLALQPSTAHGGAFYLPERGARALSMGGAQIAGADDLNAQWLNPAGLARLSGELALYLDLALVMNTMSFDRADDPEVMRKDPRYADGFPTVEHDGPPFFDPSLGVASNFGLEDFVFALGVYGPYAGTNQWDPDGPQRYSLATLEPLQAFIQLSAAWQINDMISVGLGLQWIVTSIRQRLTISSYPGVFGWAEQRDLDTFAEVDVSDPFTFGANVGVIVKPLDFLEIGASFQLPATAEAEGELQVQLPNHYYFSDTAVRGDQIQLELSFPAIIRVGARLFEPDLWSVELATVIELWSSLATIPVRPGAGGIAFDNVPGIGSFNVKPFDIQLDYDNVVSVRLGGSYTLGEAVTLRAGMVYESAAVPTTTLTVLKMDLDKLGLGAGATFRFGDFYVDVAASWIAFFTETVTDSVSSQVNPLYDEDDKPFGDTQPHVVGNGTYERTTFIVATTLGAEF